MDALGCVFMTSLTPGVDLPAKYLGWSLSASREDHQSRRGGRGLPRPAGPGGAPPVPGGEGGRARAPPGTETQTIQSSPGY